MDQTVDDAKKSRRLAAVLSEAQLKRNTNLIPVREKTSQANEMGNFTSVMERWRNETAS